jgi:hypothetical protein
LAIAAPMPLDAPVTTATLPVSLLMCFSRKVLDFRSGVVDCRGKQQATLAIVPNL